MYEIIEKKFTSWNGVERLFKYRKDTNDYNTINSIFVRDEYKIKDLPIRDGDIIIDIGSHIGGFPVALSAHFKNLGVYCYEPIPENYRLLFENLQQNDLQAFAYCWQQAVAASICPRKRIYYGDDTELGKAHKFIGNPIYVPKNNDSRGYIDVETLSLTDIFVLNDIFRVKVLKIDAEGSEFEIFNDTPKEVLGCIDYIVGELHPVPYEPKFQNLDDLLKCLKGMFEPIFETKNKGGFQEFFLKRKGL